MPGSKRPVGPFATLDEVERLMRKSQGSRVLAAFLVAGVLLALLTAAWLVGPFSPVGYWYPIAFVMTLVSLIPVLAAASRVLRVLMGAEAMATLEESREHLMAQVRVEKPPFDVCTDCRILFGVDLDGCCPQCRQKFTVMRVLGEREVRRLETLLQ